MGGKREMGMLQLRMGKLRGVAFVLQIYNVIIDSTTYKPERDVLRL